MTAALKKLGIPSSLAKRATFTCKFCKHTFVREGAYMEHQCKQMKRAAEFQTPRGQTAWRYYDLWMRSKQRMSPPPQSFLDSKLYITFINFAKFCNTVNLVAPEKFIKWAVTKDYPPSMWMSDAVYGEYMEYLDRKVDPMEQVTTSIDTVLKLAESLQVDVATIFECLDPNDVIQLIRIRRLSPWLLLFSKEFSVFFEKATPEQKAMLESLIRPEYWVNQFDEYQDEISKIKRYVQELGL